MQDFLDEFRLCPDFRDVSHTGDSADLFHQIFPGPGVGFAHQVGQLDPVHQRVKANRAGLVPVGLEQRGHLVPQVQSILVADCLIGLWAVSYTHLDVYKRQG